MAATLCREEDAARCEEVSTVQRGSRDGAVKPPAAAPAPPAPVEVGGGSGCCIATSHLLQVLQLNCLRSVRLPS